MRIAVLLPQQEAYRRWRFGLSPGPGAEPKVSLQPASGWREILLHLQDGMCDLAVVDPDPGDHAWMASPSVLELEHLRVAAEHGKVVLYTNSLPTGAGRERPMDWGGFPYVLARDHDYEPLSLRRAVATAALRKALWEEDATWRECIGPERFLLLVQLLTPWPRPRRVGCLATRRYAAERTLRERLTKLALPCPRDLMGWAVLLEGHFLTSLVHLSHQELAIHLGYDEARTLRRLSERLAGIPLGMLLQPGAFPQLAASLRTRLAASC